jgi:hypothetical protein
LYLGGNIFADEECETQGPLTGFGERLIWVRDPEWIKVRNASTAKYGDSASVRKITQYRAAAYSPIL